LNSAIGINVIHVPYRGGSQAMQDLIAGRIDYQCPNAAVAISQIEGGQIKALAMLSKNRSPILPTLATVKEQGLADFEADNWNAFFLPRKTPVAIVQKLHDAVEAAIDTPAVQERLKAIGATVVPPEHRSSVYLQSFVESEIAKWAIPIKAAGVTVE
jgi:tripartite-type tricarboxylate transporter receptor subunit TctC